MLASYKLKLILALCVSIAAWYADSPTAQAQFGGLQIQIGRGGYYGGGYGLAVPFGVGPSIPPTSRAFMGPSFGGGYRGYYGYSGSLYSGSLLPGDYGVSPFNYPSPTYRNYSYNGSGPYSGDGVSNYQQQLDLYQSQLQAEQSRLYPQQNSLYRHQQSQPGQSQSGQAQSGQAYDDLRPGMVLPDGSTVISVDPPSTNANRQPPAISIPGNAPASSPEGTPQKARSNRASF